MAATTVDFCPPSVGAQAQPAPSPASGPVPYCAACGENFASAAELRAHCKSERHVYNTKRRLNGLKPISLEAWERKLKEARAAGAAQNKGTSHLKAKKPSRKESSEVPTEVASSVTKEEEPPWNPHCCLFDNKRFETLEENLAYMWKTYNFSVPDREYCTDIPGLLTSLWTKMSEPPHACIFCNRSFPDLNSVRAHMFEKKHTRIGEQARSKRGLVHEPNSEAMRAELHDFYDFTSSTKEITDRIKDPKKKVGAITRFYDTDRDGYLNQEELDRLWTATTNTELTVALYLGACAKAGADPEVGLDEAALAALYQEGLADLDTHFAVFQEQLAQRFGKKGATEKSEREEDQEEEPDEGEESEEEDEEEDDEDGDTISSGTEIVECEDEDEFAEVMRILGLQPATITENGDLRLPSGAVAGNRDVAYIWRQRGERMGQLATTRGPPQRTPLMISNRGTGPGKLELSRQEQAREGKKIVAVLRQKNKAELRLGLQQNMLQKKKGLKVRTAYGDASGGR